MNVKGLEEETLKNAERIEKLEATRQAHLDKMKAHSESWNPAWDDMWDSMWDDIVSISTKPRTASWEKQQRSVRKKGKYSNGWTEVRFWVKPSGRRTQWTKKSVWGKHAGPNWDHVIDESHKRQPEWKDMRNWLHRLNELDGRLAKNAWRIPWRNEETSQLKALIENATKP
jgi:hypothetical protein